MARGHVFWVGVVLCVSGAAVSLTTAQSVPRLGQNTERPGDPSPPLVWVQNRGPGEAVAVSLERVTLDRPLPVEIIGSGRVEQTGRRSLTRWEYRTVAIAADQDPGAVLNAAGDEGWETTGLQRPRGDTLQVVLKRPRP